jgi:hypothetical protein
MSYKAFLKKHPEASKWEKQMFFLSYAQVCARAILTD